LENIVWKYFVTKIEFLERNYWVLQHVLLQHPLIMHSKYPITCLMEGVATCSTVPWKVPKEKDVLLILVAISRDQVRMGRYSSTSISLQV